MEPIQSHNSSSQNSIQASETTKDEGEKSIKSRLVEAISNDSDLPALGISVSRIVQLSSSDDESIRQLAYFVLSDVSLTQKILRLSNSVTYRAASNKVVTSITKAIFLLGFNSVKTSALTMLLVDGMSGKRAEHVRTELIHALAASMMSRELAKFSSFSEAEEIAVVALFKNIGRLLLAAYEHDHYQAMMELINEGTHTPGQASMKVLNFNLDAFAESILEEWRIPASITQALKNNPIGVLSVARNKQEWMQQVAEFSEKTASLVLNADSTGESELKDQLLKRFGKALNLDKAKLNQFIADANEETRALLLNADLIASDRNKKISLSTTPAEEDSEVISAEDELLQELAFHSDATDSPQITERYPSGKPYNAPMLLLSGVQDVAEIMATGEYKLEDLVMLVLETYYNSMGFRFITICLRDLKMNQFRARSSLGKNDVNYRKGFHFPSVGDKDLFHLAMQKNVDLLISNAGSPKVKELIPKWHLDLMPDARSFMVLPLVINKKPVGFFYADRESVATEGTTSEETRLIKTLKGQVLTAFNSK